MFDEDFRRSGSGFVKMASCKLVVSEQFMPVNLPLFASCNDKQLPAAAQPMCDHLSDPCGTCLSQPVQHAPKRAIDCNWVARVIECAIVNQTQEQLEELATILQFSPLHYMLNSTWPFLISGYVWF